MHKVTITRLRKEGTMWMVVLFLLLSVIVVSFSFYQMKQHELNMLTRGLYDPSPFTFVINDLEQSIDWRELNTDKPFTVFVDLGGPYRGFFYQDDTYTPPMVSGRFFQEQDFYSGKELAVVGQAVDQEFIEKLRQEGREIIGIMGASYSSKIDELILYNIDSVEEGKPISTIEGKLVSDVYVLNSSDNSLAVDDDMPFENTDQSIKAIDREDTGFMRFLGAGYDQFMIIGFFILLLVSLSLLFTYYWIGKKRTELRILWQLGIPVSQPYQRYTRTFFGIVSACYWLVGLISYVWLLQNSPNQQAGMMHIRYLLTGYGLILLSSGYFVGRAFRTSKQHIRGGRYDG